MTRPLRGGRIRSIKPEVLKDEDLWDLEVESGFPIFRAFEGLWMYSDREGRFEWRPRSLKTDILPYWNGDFSRVLDALTTRGFVVKYAFGGREYGWVRTFKEHQSINNREAQSVLPDPKGKGAMILAGLKRVTHASGTPADALSVLHQGMGRDGKGWGGSTDASPTGVDPKPETPEAPAGAADDDVDDIDPADEAPEVMTAPDVAIWLAWEQVLHNGNPAGARPRVAVFDVLRVLEARDIPVSRVPQLIREWLADRQSKIRPTFEYFARDLAGRLDRPVTETPPRSRYDDPETQRKMREDLAREHEPEAARAALKALRDAKRGTASAPTAEDDLAASLAEGGGKLIPDDEGDDDEGEAAQ